MAAALGLLHHEPRYLTEVPSSLKQLARLVVRGFYTIEDALIIDMLVRNPCMKEDDIAELLRFEKKQLRARITTLRNDKFIQVRLKMETGIDGKAQKVNYYFINYKSFVNVLKYKLDIMRKRLETEERDATSRASFKCTMCNKTFTDLEADQLFDFTTHEFRCTFCGSIVEEDSAAMPKKDSRLMLARFNDQLQPLYDLLLESEGITLAPEILEPEPVDIDTIRGTPKNAAKPTDGGLWSGEATRNQGFAVEDTQVKITFGNDDVPEQSERKERPIWMTESTITRGDDFDATDAILHEAAQQSNMNNTVIASGSTKGNRGRSDVDDIMNVLLQHEKQRDQKEATRSLAALAPSNANTELSDTSDDEKDLDNIEIPMVLFNNVASNNYESDDDDLPTVHVGGKPYPISKISAELISAMTPQEKEHYICVYQHHYSHIHD